MSEKRPSLDSEKYEKFLEFVLKKYGTIHRKAKEELGRAIDEYLERHKEEVAEGRCSI